MNCVDTEGSLDLSVAPRVPAQPRIGRYMLQPGDVVFNATSSRELVGKSALFTGWPEPVSFSNHFQRIRTRRELLEPAYLARWLTWQQRRGTFAGISARWVNQAVVRNERLLALKIPLTSLPEQRRIAAVLDKADMVRRKRRESLRLLDEFLRSAFLEMFGDPVSNDKGWDRRALKDLAVITTGNTPSRSNADFYGDAVEWIKSDNINTPGHYATRAMEGLSAEGRRVGRVVSADSILMTCIAGSPDCIGNVAIADRAVAFNQQINAITPGVALDHRFLYTQFLVGKRLVQRASTSSMKGMVSKGQLEKVRISVPPLQIQNAFGELFGRLMVTRSSLERSISHSLDLFDSLAHQSFNGEL